MPVSYGHISKTNQYYDIDIMISKKKEEMNKKMSLEKFNAVPASCSGFMMCCKTVCRLWAQDWRR